MMTLQLQTAMRVVCGNRIIAVVSQLLPYRQTDRLTDVVPPYEA